MVPDTTVLLAELCGGWWAGKKILQKGKRYFDVADAETWLSGIT